MDKVQALFGIDPMTPQEIFTGWHHSDIRWNGWATPAFDREVAEKVIAWVAKGYEGYDEPPTTFAWDGDVLVMSNHEYEDDEGWEPERIEPDADGRYGIGAFSWVWSEIEPPEGVDVAEWFTEQRRLEKLYSDASNKALEAVYAKDPKDVRGATAAGRAAGDAALEADARYKDPAYEMPEWFAVASDFRQEFEWAEHAWLLSDPTWQLAKIKEWEATRVFITRDGKRIADVADVNAAYGWLLRHQSQSVSWAIENEGYRIVDAEDNDAQ